MEFIKDELTDYIYRDIQLARLNTLGIILGRF